MPMPRRTKIALAVGGTVVAIPLIAVVVLLNYDWNHARPWLNAKATEALHRPVAIRGDLTLSWQKQPVAPSERTWRDWIPWPHLQARDVHMGNPPNMTQGDMAAAKSLSFSLNPFSLLHKEIAIPELRFESPHVELLRTDATTNNWTFVKNPPSKWKMDLDRVVFTQGVVHLADEVEKIDATAELDTLANDPKYSIGWKLSGNWNKQTITGHGKTGAVLALQDSSLPFPVQGDIKAGLINVAAEGTLKNPVHLAAVDMHLKVGGASMARLYPFTGLVLPETPAFTTQGHLLGNLAKGEAKWSYEDFTGRVGDSDISGKLAYQQDKPRGLMTGNVRSRLLQFKDLGPLIGADSNASKEARGVAPNQPSDKLLPVEKFKTERWTALDANVTFRAEHIVRTKQLPVSNLYTEFHLKDGVLKLTPLNFDFAGGNLASTVKLDGSGNKVKDAIAAELSATGKHIKLKELFPNMPQIQATVGEINAEAKLSATGNSVATLMASSNGELKALINDGTISKLLLEQMGLNIGNVVLAKLFGDKPVHLNCLAGDFAVEKGVAQTRTLIMDTEDAVVHVNGNVNLASEDIDLTLKPDSKGLRIVSLRSPIYVKGTLKHPDVSIDKGVLAMRAGGAIALATLAAPVAALAPLISGGSEKDNNCAALLAEAKEKPVAPPPGKPLSSKKAIK
ncbi:AsmA family protein [Pseudoduganella sp. RAF53_2]|uniref:AsmA family protein n=2 Tax=unclassified Pseudoduganella TaxID=2637179 RepID=UPI003F9B4A7F